MKVADGSTGTPPSPRTTEAEISVRNEWMIGAKPVITEVTTIRTRERSGARIVDLGYRFTSDDELAAEWRAL